MNTKIGSVTDVKRSIGNNDYKIFGIGGTPITRAEIYSLIDDFELICTVPSGDLACVQKKLRVTCFEMRNEKGFYVKKPDKILANPKVVEHIKERSKNKKVGILLMKPTKKATEICERNGWTLLGNKDEIVKKYNNKNEFQELLKKINVPTNAISVNLTELPKELNSAFEKLGNDIVIQLPESCGGRGTFFFNKKQQEEIPTLIKKRVKTLNEDVPDDSRVVINSFFEGPSLSSLGCVTKENGTISCDPQYQLIGIEKVTCGKTDATGVFCGNDWVLSNDIPNNIKEQSQEITEKIGNKLKENEVFGIFGVDYIWDKKRDVLVPNEINVRITGAFPTIVFSQLEAGTVPLIAFHVLDFLDISYSLKDSEIYNNRKRKKGAHLILFNPKRHDVVCGNEISGGVYSLDKEKHVKFERLGFEFNDIKNPKEFIITDGIPSKGVVRKKNKKIVKIITKETICKSPQKLNRWGNEIVTATYEALDLKKKKERLEII
ncbi:MAG: hypothetical protein U9O20_04330 [Patescibacteria group bacterium]|nr:hypothetical protein [Patescibacteria group bacterium]